MNGSRLIMTLPQRKPGVSETWALESRRCLAQALP